MSIPTLAGPLAACAVLIVAALFGAWALRDRWDLLAAHSRDAVRHILSAVLMLGTASGTVWTFSNGRLSLSGFAESLVSVGGIVAALEVGAIYCGLFLGDLDSRIASARKADIREALVSRRHTVAVWFYITVGFSAAANYIFRMQQIGWWQAILPTIAPVGLIILFTVVLRPLPRDYAEIQRQSVQRGLTLFATHAQAALLRGIRRMAHGVVLSEQELAQMATALSFMRPYVTGDQSQALDQAFGAPAARLGAGVSGNESAGEWLASADIARLYGVPTRTAQTWLAQTPNRRQRPHSRAWEAPAATIYAAHGVPASPTGNLTGSGADRMRKRQNTPVDATEAPATAVDALIVEATPQFAVYEAPISADEAPGSVARSV